MINKITFTKKYTLKVERNSHYKFGKVKQHKPSKEGRPTPAWEEFTLFKKGLEIPFENFNILVGENGCGKTTLMELLVDKISTNNVEEIFLNVSEEIERNSILYLNGVDSNPVLLLKAQMDKLGSSTPSHLIVDWYIRKEHSHGENRLDFWADIENDKEFFTNKVLIFDEPEIGLSIKNSLKIFNLLKELEKQNCQIFIITHNYLWISKVQKVLDMETRKWIDSKKYIKKQTENE